MINVSKSLVFAGFLVFYKWQRATEHRRIPGAHCASCPLLVVAMAPWIIPDLRMKRVFEEAKRREE